MYNSDIVERCDSVLAGDVQEWQCLLEIARDAKSEVLQLREDTEYESGKKKEYKDLCVKLLQALEAQEREQFNMRKDLGWTNFEHYVPSKLISETKETLNIR